MIWHLSHRFDPAAKAIADRHYNRQTPESPQFVPPGRCLVLKTAHAVWITSWPEFAQHAWVGAWMNTCFRREAGPLASEMIREAVACSRWKWPTVPALGMVTFVDPAKVEHKRQPGRCYLKAGFRHVGYTEGGLLAYQLAPEDMPAAEPPLGATFDLLAVS